VSSSSKLGAAGYFASLVDGYDAFGCAVASIGDMDGDGVGELAIGATGDDDGAADAGAVWIAFLDGTGLVKTHGKISNTEGGLAGPSRAETVSGRPSRGLEDLNRDGVPDLLGRAAWRRRRWYRCRAVWLST